MVGPSIKNRLVDHWGRIKSPPTKLQSYVQLTLHKVAKNGNGGNVLFKKKKCRKNWIPIGEKIK